jgi:archaellum biogenesis protein FlaJ (TadC family)
MWRLKKEARELLAGTVEDEGSNSSSNSKVLSEFEFEPGSNDGGDVGYGITAANAADVTTTEDDGGGSGGTGVSAYDDDGSSIRSSGSNSSSKKYRYYSTPATSRAAGLLTSPGARARAFRAALISTAALYAFVFTSHPVMLAGFAIATFDLVAGLEKIPLWVDSAAAVAAAAAREKAVQRMRFSVREVPAAVERMRAYRWARKEFQERLRLASAGVALAGSATDRARKYLNTMLAISPAMIFAAGAAAVMVHPYFAFLIAVPGAVIAMPFLSLKLKKAERGEIDDELPFFLIVAEMLAFVEKPLIHVFELVARSGDMLPKMRVEAEVVRRDVNAFGYTPDQAIDRLAKTHPNTELRLVLNGYSSSMSLGQSVAQYLQNKAETYLGRLEAKYERYKENVGTVGELVLIMLMIMPLTASISGSGGGGGTGPQQTMLILAIPLISVAMFFMLDKAQVKGPDRNRASQSSSSSSSQLSLSSLLSSIPLIPTISAAATVAAIAILFFMLPAGGGTATTATTATSLDPAIMLLAPVAAFSLPYGIVARRRMKAEDSMLLELAEFLRTIAEVMKTGMDVVSAIRHTGVERFTVLRPHIRRIKHGLASGRTLDSIQLLPSSTTSSPTSTGGGRGGGGTQTQPSFYMRYSLLIMSALATSGAANHAMLDRLAEYLGRIREQDAKARKSVMIYGFMVLASPLFMMFTVHAMAAMTGQFMIEDTDNNGGSGGGQSQVNVPGGFGKMPTFFKKTDPNSPEIKAMLIMTALGAGVLGGKMVSRTARDTMPLAISCLITLVSPVLLDVVWPLK